MKKFISLFLVFSLMMLPTSLYAKKRGAKLIVTKLDGQLIKGELIAVKPNSLLLLDTEGKDVSVDIVDIKVIEIVKKLMEKAGLGAGIGALIGITVGTLIWSSSEFAEEEEMSFAGSLILGTLVGALPGALVGGIIGVAAGPGKRTFQIEGMTNSEINKVLAKLRKKARIRDYK